eukprot:4700641-Pyramimonas_sp.AAC.1
MGLQTARSGVGQLVAPHAEGGVRVQLLAHRRMRVAVSRGGDNCERIRRSAQRWRSGCSSTLTMQTSSVRSSQCAAGIRTYLIQLSDLLRTLVERSSDDIPALCSTKYRRFALPDLVLVVIESKQLQWCFAPKVVQTP